MAIRKPQKIESVLLYHDFEAVDPKDIVDQLNFVLENANIRFELKLVLPDDTHCMMMGNGLYVQVSQTRQPLAIDGFGPALTSPHTGMIFPDAAEIVRHHKSRIFITVGKGVPIPGAEEVEKTLDMPDMISQGTFETMLTICQVLTRQMARRNKPLAIHWCQSDQLMTADYFDKISGDAFPIALFVHPSYYSSRAVVNDKQVIGLRTFGAAHLFGKEIVFNEAPVPPGFIYGRTVQFLEMARRSGAIIPDGESFGESEREIIRVRHLPAAENDPNGSVELTLERSDTYGIGDVQLPGEAPLSDQAMLPGEAPLREETEQAEETPPAGETASSDEPAPAENSTPADKPEPLEEGPAYRPFQDEDAEEAAQAEEPVQRDEEAARKRAEMLRAMRDKMRSEIAAPDEAQGGGLFGGLGRRFRGRLN